MQYWKEILSCRALVCATDTQNAADGCNIVVRIAYVRKQLQSK
jgi:hypothetical protein